MKEVEKVSKSWEMFLGNPIQNLKAVKVSETAASILNLRKKGPCTNLKTEKKGKFHIEIT